VKELTHISPRAYHRLLDYHWRCSTAAIGVATTFEWMLGMGWGGKIPIPECNKCAVSSFARRSGGKISPSKYWTEYIERVKIALKDRPCSASVLKADLIDSAKRDATKCLYCCTTAGMAMWQFTEVFADEIKQVTSVVSFHEHLSTCDVHLWCIIDRTRTRVLSSRCWGKTCATCVISQLYSTTGTY
jgi:hypothetical protein